MKQALFLVVVFFAFSVDAILFRLISSDGVSVLRQTTARGLKDLSKENIEGLAGLVIGNYAKIFRVEGSDEQDLVVDVKLPKYLIYEDDDGSQIKERVCE